MGGTDQGNDESHPRSKPAHGESGGCEQVNVASVVDDIASSEI